MRAIAKFLRELCAAVAETTKFNLCFFFKLHFYAYSGASVHVFTNCVYLYGLHAMRTQDKNVPDPQLEHVH